MSDTGGGHRASANALRDAFNTIEPGKIKCDIVDIYTEYGPFFPLNSYPAMYKIMAEYSFLWKGFYEFGSTPFGLWLNDFLLETFCFDAFKKCIERDAFNLSRRADMVVSVHPLTQELPLKILSYLDTNGESREYGRTTPFVTVVTDLGGAHPTWFNPGVDKCFVPSDALYQCARDREVQPEQIVQHGLPIRKGFWGGSSLSTTERASTPIMTAGSSFPNFFSRLFGGDTDVQATSDDNFSSGDDKVSKDKESLRTQLGLQTDYRTVLVVGGGDGMGGIVETARQLGDKLGIESSKVNQEFQMVVVCGNNKQAQTTLSGVKWNDGVNVCVKGFVDNMDEWMRASDVIVTKAGPGTIAEASICGLPCMLSSYLPGQEEGNVPYVKDNGFGSYSGNPQVIAETVCSWLESDDMMESMKAAALEASRPSATLDIARDIANVLFESKRRI